VNPACERAFPRSAWRSHASGVLCVRTRYCPAPLPHGPISHVLAGLVQSRGLSRRCRSRPRRGRGRRSPVRPRRPVAGDKGACFEAAAGSARVKDNVDVVVGAVLAARGHTPMPLPMAHTPLPSPPHSALLPPRAAAAGTDWP
jgi:hypothetical protein